MDSKHEGRERDAADDEELWKLLGRSRPVEVSPFFVRRVLRDMDAGAASPGGGEFAGGWRNWLRPVWILAGSTAALALVIGLFSLPSLTDRTPSPAVRQRRALPSVAVAVAVPSPSAAVIADPAAPTMAANKSTAEVDLGDDVSPQDMDVIADLDNLVAREETNVWTDDTSRF